jgi:threonine dehydrogenase-like Zn-dependent dehydrogenase
MKAVVWHGVGDVRIDDVPEPRIEEPTDAVVRVTTAAICGTDLHFVRGTVPNMKPGLIFGHEGVGVVEEVGKDVRNFRPGDRVLLSAVLGCGSCAYCRSGRFAQCDGLNPDGSAFYGANSESGSFNGLQAEYARVPFARTPTCSDCPTRSPMRRRSRWRTSTPPATSAPSSPMSRPAMWWRSGAVGRSDSTPSCRRSS